MEPESLELEDDFLIEAIIGETDKGQEQKIFQNLNGDIPLVFPEKFSGYKVLFELPSSKDSFETDLSGDTGAVGRFLVSPKGDGETRLKVDLKGVLYDGEPMQLAGTCMVVSLAPTGAKVEAVFNDFVRLSKDDSVQGDRTEGLFDFMDQDDEDEGFAPSARHAPAGDKVTEDGEGGGTGGDGDGGAKSKSSVSKMKSASGKAAGGQTGAKKTPRAAGGKTHTSTKTAPKAKRTKTS